MGQVGDIFTADRLARLPGPAAIGHVRYSTAGDSSLKNAQPIAVDYAGGSVAIAHNGNLVNVGELRARLEDEGSIFPDHLRHRGDRPPDRPVARGRAFPSGWPMRCAPVRGAYLAGGPDPQQLIAVRDPMGFRPLSLGTGAGRLGGGVGDLRLRADRGRASSATSSPARWWSSTTRASAACARSPPRARAAACSSASTSRAPTRPSTAAPSIEPARAWGAGWRVEHPVEADVVIPVPDSGIAAAIGYARESGIPFEQGLMRSHYVGRTFIEPSQSIRHFGVKLKLSPVREVLDGQARGGRRRLDRARHDLAQDRRHDPRGRRARGAHAHQLAAHRGPLPLRHRHAARARS